MNRRRSIGLGAVLLLVAAAVFWWWQGRLERSQDRPIEAAARRYRVEPALVKAVVWRESHFKPSVRGRAGELGLMQIRDLASQEWADAEHIESFQHEHCLDPGTNTLAATWYLAKLLKRYTHTDNPSPTPSPTTTPDAATSSNGLTEPPPPTARFLSSRSASPAPRLMFIQ